MRPDADIELLILFALFIYFSSDKHIRIYHDRLVTITVPAIKALCISRTNYGYASLVSL